ncbi:hypothetical protein [Streptomyces sp. NP160]|nr:hypothetical protein [Streptomyces sp. NP160]
MSPTAPARQAPSRTADDPVVSQTARTAHRDDPAPARPRAAAEREEQQP